MAFTTQLNQITDFVGFLNLSENIQDSADFDSLAKDVEVDMFRRLLGDEITVDLYADLDGNGGTPTIQKYIDLLNGVNWTDSEADIHILTGAKFVARYFIYRDWAQQLPYKPTESGTVINANENSTVIERQQLNAETDARYNKGSELYTELLTFVKRFESVTVDYTGISEVAGTYTVLLPSTLYLEVGDTMTINNTLYTVQARVQNVQVTFVAATGLVFDATGPVKWTPFVEPALCSKDPIYFNSLS